MTQLEKVYEYLVNNYSENEPIFLSDICIDGIKDVSVRQQLKKLTEDDRIKRYDSGIYFIPKKTMFKSGSTLSIDEIIRKKYLIDGKTQCGYMSGLTFANKLGLTTQVPMFYEVCSNKATTDYRDMRIGKFRVILRRPYVEITDQNVNELQFLDLIREVNEVSELEGEELTKRLTGYLRTKGIKFDALGSYLQYYPERIYKNMYEVGLLRYIGMEAMTRR